LRRLHPELADLGFKGRVGGVRAEKLLEVARHFDHFIHPGPADVAHVAAGLQFFLVDVRVVGIGRRARRVAGVRLLESVSLSRLVE